MILFRNFLPQQKVNRKCCTLAEVKHHQKKAGGRNNLFVEDSKLSLILLISCTRIDLNV